MKATSKMVNYAETIADRLGIEPPDYSDYDEVESFICFNKWEFYRTQEPRRAVTMRERLGNGE